ncbi:hypothetical protein KSS87_004687 [Heliosperma pusillum]|nr:hypothetical protein KSS87_004687 [Heliosperma pusillum]
MGKGGGCVPSKKKLPPTTTTTTTTPTTASTIAPPPPKPSTSSSSSSTPTSPTATTTAPTTTTNTAPNTTTNTAPLKLLIVFYSMYGHVEHLARRMKKGVDSVDGVEAVLYRVPETLSNDVLSQMMAPEKDDSIPVISSPADLVSGSGFLFGFPTRYGSMSAQMKAFFDSTGPLWKDQSLAGKPAGFFVSTGTQGGGQETTAIEPSASRLVRPPFHDVLKNQGSGCLAFYFEDCLLGENSETRVWMDGALAILGCICFVTALIRSVLSTMWMHERHLEVHYSSVKVSWTAITQLAHHGMLFVPIGYTFGAGMFKMDSIRGGSPYGAGVFAGDGTRQPTDTELALAEHQGKYMAAVVKRLAHP